MVDEMGLNMDLPPKEKGVVEAVSAAPEEIGVSPQPKPVKPKKPKKSDLAKAAELEDLKMREEMEEQALRDQMNASNMAAEALIA